MINITIDKNTMILSVIGMHKLWALKSEMVIPTNQIISARINKNEILKPEGWRAPGAYIPGLITAGTYRSHGDKVFWDVMHPEKSIIIDFRECEYKQLILEVENPEKIVLEINNEVDKIYV